MKNILVIGSNSFSGANFIAYALARGYKVTGISRSPEKNKVMLPYKWRSTKNFVFFQLNIVNDIIEIDKLIKEEPVYYDIQFRCSKYGWRKLGQTSRLDAN